MFIHLILAPNPRSHEAPPRVTAFFNTLLVPDADLGSRPAGFVSFIDFGPTVLNLAGAALPDGIDGKPFLGSGTSMAEVNSRDTAFGYADRMDEKYDFVRTVRKGKYHYMRNFQPHLADGLQNNYRYRMLGFVEWRKMFLAGKLNDQQSQFFRSRPVEQLFDCETDPHNLAGDPAYAAKLVELRGILGNKMRSLPDLSLVAESYMIDKAMPTVPANWGQKNKVALVRYADIADLAVAKGDESIAEPLLNALRSDDPLDRYWACMAAMAHLDSKPVRSLILEFEKVLDDDFPLARVRAAELLSEMEHADPQPVLAEVINATSNPVVATEALQAVVHFDDKRGIPSYPADVSKLKPNANNDGVERRMGYLLGDEFGWKNKKARKK